LLIYLNIHIKIIKAKYSFDTIIIDELIYGISLYSDFENLN